MSCESPEEVSAELSQMYQREKVSCWLKAILIAMKMIRSSFVLDIHPLIIIIITRGYNQHHIPHRIDTDHQKAAVK